MHVIYEKRGPPFRGLHPGNIELVYFQVTNIWPYNRHGVKHTPSRKLYLIPTLVNTNSNKILLAQFDKTLQTWPLLRKEINKGVKEGRGI